MPCLRKTISVALIALLCMGAAFPAAASADRDHVIIGELNWSGGVIIAHIMKHVLEKRLGIPAKLRPIAPEVLWSAMDKGSMDVYPDLWMPNQKEKFAEYVEKRKSVAVKVSYDNAPQGIYMMTKLAEANGIRSVFDLKGKEKRFDMNGNGLGEMWVGPYSWAATAINKSKIKEYGLPFEPVEFEQWIFFAVLKEAMAAEKPLVFYYWEPDWPLAVYDMRRLEEPVYDPEKWGRDRGDGGKPRYRCAYPPATVYVGVSRQLEARTPRAFAFFMNWHIPIDEVSRLVADIEDVPGNPRKDKAMTAQNWVDNHPEILADWLRGLENLK